MTIIIRILINELLSQNSSFLQKMIKKLNISSKIFFVIILARYCICDMQLYTLDILFTIQVNPNALLTYIPIG